MKRLPIDYMQLALEKAQEAAQAGEVPVGAIIVSAEGQILAQTHNEMKTRRDPTAHAELLAIQAACAAIEEERLEGATLYVTLEPCPMCAQAASFARLESIFFGAYDPKGGGVEYGARIYQQTSCHHKPVVHGGVLEHASQSLLQNFFSALRDNPL